MPLIDVTVPNLINGVSQQANNLRFSSQCDEQINFLSSLTDGLQKRPPSRHIAELFPTTNKLFVADIVRDASRQYMAFVKGGLNPSLRVFTTGGVELPVRNASGSPVAPSDLAYLATDNPGESLRALTVEDTTFVVNQDKVTAKLPHVMPTRPHEALVMVKTIHSKSVYSISLFNDPLSTEPSFTASHTTGENTAEDQGGLVMSLVQGFKGIVLTTTTVMQHINAGHGGSIQVPVTVEVGNGNTSSGDATGTYDFTEGGGVLYIKKKDGSDFRVEVYCTNAESIYAFKDTVQNFSMLPKRGWAGFTIKVSGDPETKGDEYFLKYEPSTVGLTEFATGFWTETFAGGLQDSIDPDTLPHLLENHGTYFVFKPTEWGTRSCGDDLTNPYPSFVGKPLRGLFFHRNRLGLLADENAILSENGKFYNFWRTTVIQVLDSDPIDCNAPASRVSLLNHAVASSEKFFLFSEQTQFTLNGGDLLTPKSASISETTDFANSRTVAPIALGNRLYYTFKRGDYSGVAEYSLQSQSGLFDADDVTDHVPRYIAGDVTRFFGSDTEKTIFATSSGYTTGIYVYRFYYHSGDRLLSSWSKWDFGAPVRYAFMANTALYVVVERHGSLFLECIDLQSGKVDDGSKFTVHLDRRVSDSMLPLVYDPVLNRTTFTLPYVPTPAYAAVVTRVNGGGQVEGIIIPTTSVVGAQLTVVGDYRGAPLWFGENYYAEYKMSQPRLREAKKDGGASVIVPGRFQVRNGYLAYHSTLYFRTEVQLTGGRPVSIKPFTPRSVGGLVLLGASIDPVEGTHRFSVFSRSDQVSIKIINDTPLPCALTSVDWEAMYSYRAQRV